MQVFNLKYGLSGNVEFARYARKQVAILILSEDGDKVATSTVNLEGWDVSDPPEGFVHIKNWSENEGMVEALEKAGVIERPFKSIFGGWNCSCEAILAKLTPAALAELKEQEK